MKSMIGSLRVLEIGGVFLLEKQYYGEKGAMGKFREIVFSKIHELNYNNNVMISNFKLLEKQAVLEDKYGIISQCLNKIVSYQELVIEYQDNQKPLIDEKRGIDVAKCRQGMLEQFLEQFNGNNGVIIGKFNNKDDVEISKNNQNMILQCLEICVNCQEVIIYYQKSILEKINYQKSVSKIVENMGCLNSRIENFFRNGHYEKRMRKQKRKRRFSEADVEYFGQTNRVANKKKNYLQNNI